MAKAGKVNVKVKKKDKKNIPEGIVYIYSNFLYSIKILHVISSYI